MTEYVDIVFDGPPSHDSGRFVEVEDDQKKSFPFGVWIDRGDGYWVLRVPTPTEDPEFLAVRRLYRKFGFIESATPTHLTTRKYLERIAMMAEEGVIEFARAAAKQDMAGMFDALLDLVVFAKGTASMMGLPWKTGFDDVDRANSAKERGVTKRGFRDDITKPPGWVGPKTMEILITAGYDRKLFTVYPDGGGPVHESLCLDDDQPLSMDRRRI